MSIYFLFFWKTRQYLPVLFDRMMTEAVNMGFYAKLVEREMKKRRGMETEARPLYEEHVLTEAEWREARLRRLRPDYSREKILSSFGELRGLKNRQFFVR